MKLIRRLLYREIETGYIVTSHGLSAAQFNSGRFDQVECYIIPVEDVKEEIDIFQAQLGSLKSQVKQFIGEDFNKALAEYIVEVKHAKCVICLCNQYFKTKDGKPECCEDITNG